MLSFHQAKVFNLLLTANESLSEKNTIAHAKDKLDECYEWNSLSRTRTSEA